MLPVPAIPWVHDCDIFDHPEWFPQSWWKRQITTRLFLRGIRRAPHIFAASEYTKHAIERLVPSAKGRITVTGEGGDAELAAIPSDRLADMKQQAAVRLTAQGITRPFVLMLGTLEPRKNISLICRLWPQVAQTSVGTDLVIAGQDGWKTTLIHDAIQQCQRELTSTDSRLILFQKKYSANRETFSEQDRRDLLLAARIVLVPSFSEGFGLVALEAIQAGTPVLASNRGALPEVVGEGEWLLDPDDASGWQAAIISVLSDSATRERISLAQQDHRARHSWERTARIIMEGIIPSPHVPPQAVPLPKRIAD
jgi:glycosyltransferase involved in cell wall biosynthesis